MSFWNKNKETENEQVSEPGVGKVKNIIAIASGKGGVGKSTVTTNLAMALSEQGHKVGVLDADIYGPSQPIMLGSHDGAQSNDGYAIPVKSNGVSFISMSTVAQQKGPTIMRAPIALKILNQFLTSVMWGELDYLLIDLPPGTGDIQLTLAQQAKLTGAIIVTTPQKVSVEISQRGLQMFQQLNIPIIGVIENMSGFTCSHCQEVTAIFKEGGAANMCQEFDVPFLGAIPLDPLIMMSSDEGRSLSEDKEGHAYQAYQKVAESFAHQLESSAANKMLEVEKVQLEEDTGRVILHWNNGEMFEYEAFSLRAACPCASCVDENTGQKTLDVNQIPSNIKVIGAKPVGRYGLSFTFSDGHGTGIYKFDRLRREFEQQGEVSV